jgi:hypothetical protein
VNVYVPDALASECSSGMPIDVTDSTVPDVFQSHVCFDPGDEMSTLLGEYEPELTNTSGTTS